MPRPTPKPTHPSPDPDALPRSAGPPPKQIYIAWIGFQRRAASMAQFLDLEVHHLPPVESRWLKPFGYLGQALRTARVLRAARPDIVWVQSPPTFLPLLLLALRPVAGRFRLLADCHNGALEPPWSRVPGASWALRRCDAVIVHNDEIRPAARALGVEPERLRVLEDPPPRLDPPPPAAEPVEPYVLVPCSFAADEPIPVLLEAARQAPELAFRVTGSRRKAEALGLVAAAPPNVSFPGYLPLPDFERLLAEAAVVLGLTSVEGIQLSVGNEALGAGRPLVLSDTRILRAMFGEAAVFARNSPEALVAALRDAMARRPALAAASAALATRRQAQWRAAARACLEA